MPRDKSTAKRIRQNEKNRLKNKAFKSRLKTEVRKVLESCNSGNKESAEKALKKTIPVIDKAVSKGVLHRNTGSRKISRISKRVARINVQS